MASCGSLFLVLFILVAFSSSSSTIEAREGKLFFSKYIHSSTNQNPISEISSSPSSAPAVSPAPSPVSADERQSTTAYGLWGAGSGLVVPQKAPSTAAAAADNGYPTYKDDEELEEALNESGSVDSAAAEENRVDENNKQYGADDNGYHGESSSSYGNEMDGFNGRKTGRNSDQNVNLVATNNGYNNVDYSKQYKYNNNNYNNNDEEDNHGYSASTKPQYQYQSYNGDSYGTSTTNYDSEEKDEEFSGENNNNQYKLGSAQFNKRDEGFSFAANGNGNGEREVERQGMSDTRYIAGGKYYYDVNQQFP